MVISERLTILGGRLRFVLCPLQFNNMVGGFFAKRPGEGKNRARPTGRLVYRLHVFAIPLPPLRERRGRMPRLTQAFLTEFGRTFAQDATSVRFPRRTE